jgi:hypothetical protein
LDRKICGSGPQAMDHDRAHSPLWIGGGTNTRSLGRGGVLARAWPPTTPWHGSSPARAQKREGSAGEPISGLTGAQTVVWWAGDGDEAATALELIGGGA